MSEIKFDKQKYDTKMGYLTMMKERLSLVGINDVVDGDNILSTTDKLISMYEDIREIMRKYKWALDYDIASLIAIGVAWETEDTYVANKY